MAGQRKRYYAKDNIKFNDKKVDGQELVLVGPCNFSGHTKSVDGKSIPKKQLDYVKLKFTDKKWLKENDLLSFSEYVCKKDHLLTFFSEAGS